MGFETSSKEGVISRCGTIGGVVVMLLLCWNSHRSEERGSFCFYTARNLVLLLLLLERKGEIVHIGHGRKGCVCRKWNLEGKVALWVEG